jgi:putative membrane protein
LPPSGRRGGNPSFGTLHSCLLLPGLALTGLYLWRQGKLPRFGGSRPPEAAAKRILAERFAQGDIGSDEFLERASMLNWALGTNPLLNKGGRNRS